MKRPQPDLEQLLVSTFVQTMGHTRKFKRLWGTAMRDSNGEMVEVLTPRQYYHPIDKRMGYVAPGPGEEEIKVPKEFKKLVDFLGIYDETVKSSKKGLKEAWLYLNKNNANNTLVDPDGFVEGNLEKVFWDPADGPVPQDLTLTTTLVIDGLIDPNFTTYLDDNPEGNLIKRRVNTTSLLSPSMTQEQLIQAVEDNYETLWNTCVIWQEGIGVVNKGTYTDPVTSLTLPDEDDLSPEDPWLNILSRYALRNNGIDCTVKSVEIGLREALVNTSTPTVIEYQDPYGSEEEAYVEKVTYNSYIVTLEIPYSTFSTLLPMVVDIATDIEGTYTKKQHALANTNEFYSQKAVRALDSSDLDEPGEVVTRAYQAWEDAVISADARYDALWVEVDGAYRLKADIFTRPSDYGLTFEELGNYLFLLIDTGYKKKKVKWYKKALAFIVFIVAFIFAPGNIAAKIIFASMVLTVVSVAFSILGMEEWAMAFAEVNKTLEPLVMIASIYMAFTAIAKQIGTKQLTAEAAKKAVSDFISDLVEDMIKEIIDGATDVFAGNLLTADAMKFLSRAVDLAMMPTKMKLEDLNDRNRDLKAEYEELVQEMAREYDVLQGFARIYASPATADWSMYAAMYDLPYETGGGPMALGNIQRTTKQAIRKGSYDDPAFDNILVV